MVATRERPAQGKRLRAEQPRSSHGEWTASRFAEAYADRNERDHHALQQAVAAGRVHAEAAIA